MGELIIWWLLTEEVKAYLNGLPAATWPESKEAVQFPEQIPLVVRNWLLHLDRITSQGGLRVLIAADLESSFTFKWTPELQDKAKVTFRSVRQPHQLTGIVMWRHDIEHVRPIGGLFTDRELNRIEEA